MSRAKVVDARHVVPNVHWLILSEFGTAVELLAPIFTWNFIIYENRRKIEKCWWYKSNLLMVNDLLVCWLILAVHHTPPHSGIFGSSHNCRDNLLIHGLILIWSSVWCSSKGTVDRSGMAARGGGGHTHVSGPEKHEDICSRQCAAHLKLLRLKRPRIDLDALNPIALDAFCNSCLLFRHSSDIK